MPVVGEPLQRAERAMAGIDPKPRPAGLQKPQTTDELGAMLREPHSGSLRDEWASETEGLWR